MVETKLATKIGKFNLGDIVASYHCEEGNTHMPGHGKVILIEKGSERPYICEHNGKIYRFKGKEIEEPDNY